MTEYTQISKLEATKIQTNAAVRKQNVCQDKKDKIRKGIYIILTANDDKRKNKTDKKVVMSIICHKCSLSNNLWKKNISEV